MATTTVTPTKSTNLQAIANYGGKFKKEIFSTIMHGLDVAKDTTLYPNIKNSLNLTKLDVNGEPMPYNSKDDTSEDDLVYSGRKISVYPVKRELTIDPEDYRPTWQAEYLQAKASGKDPIPFSKYVFQKIVEGIQNKINDETAFDGIRKGSGKKAKDICNGFNTIIKAEITAGNLIPVVTGALTKANIIANVKKVFRSLSTAQKRAGANVYLSQDAYELYCDAYDEQYGKYTGSDDFRTIRGTDKKAKVMGTSWMKGDRIVATPKANLITGTDMITDMEDLDVQKVRFTIWIGIKFVLGFEIRDLAAMVVNDQG